MDGEIIHYIDGIQVEEPMGWKDLEEEYSRSVRDRLITVKYSGELTFTGGSYDIIRQAYDADGFCKVLQYEARQRCGGVLSLCARGVLILADAEWNLTRCVVKIPLVDNGPGATIISNKDIPVSPTSTLSKNGIDIADTPVVALTLHNVSDGTAVSGTRRAWDWWAAMQHAFAYISDGTAVVTSDWYNALPDEERYAIIDGWEVRNGDGANPRISYTWGDIFDNLATKYNLWIAAIRDASGVVVYRIEPEQTFLGAAGGVMQLDIQDLVRSIDTDRLYARVTVGADDFKREYTGSGYGLPYIPLRTHGKEAYHLSGTCNTRETLELTGDWQYDTNVIEAVIDGADDYDDDLFIVQYTASTSESTQGTYLNTGSAPYLYNEALLNSAVIGRYRLASSVGSFWDPTNASFLAERVNATNTPEVFILGGTGVISPTIVQFDDDYTSPNFDTSNAWGNGTTQGNPVSQANSRFTAPAVGYYEFNINVDWAVIDRLPNYTAPSNSFLFMRMALYCLVERYNASNTLISTQMFTSAYHSEIGDYSHAFTAGLSMSAGDYIVVKSQFYVVGGFDVVNIGSATPANSTAQATVVLRAGSSIGTSFVAGGGYIDGGGPAAILKYTFDRHCTLSDWLSLTEQPESALTISNTSAPLTTGWVLNAKRNTATGAAQWEVIAYIP